MPENLKTGESQEVLNARSRKFYTILSVCAGAIVAFGFLMNSGVIDITLQTLAEYLGGAAVTITIAFFAYIIFFGGHTRDEQKKLGVIFWLFILAALFWSGFEQAGSSLNLFAKDLTNRSIGDIAWLDGGTALIITALIAIPLFYVVYRVFKRENLWSFRQRSCRSIISRNHYFPILADSTDRHWMGNPGQYATAH
ncbi:MAG: hypothetical protein U5J63_04615 [Fodinibius sp.]|nr:hypothetical protein [Fodinibius sp.]